MKFNGTTLAALAGMATLAASFAVPSAFAIATENPYQVIWERNPFQLKPPVVAPLETNAPPAPPSNIELTGITTYTGEKQVFLVLKDPQGKASHKTFTEGQRQDAVEVLSIDVKAGAVRLRNAGVETVLTFEKGGAAIPKGAAPVPMAPPVFGGGGVVPPPGFPVPPMTGQPAFNNLPTPGNANPAGFTDPSAGAPRVIPQRSVRVPPAPPGAQNSVTPQALTPATPPMTVEEQHILMSINSMLDKRSGAIKPPLPVDLK
ncbi:MAG: hypothetical protein HY301_03640 [Verrucomicrobia bacterium]|nr:hypothetical protein [Verrucomicrobiota bacterium]